MGKFIDLTGMRFGRLVVIGVDDEKTKEKGKIYWKCKCDCGNITSVSTYKLKSGNTQSCKCLHNELLSERNKLLRCKYNQIYVSDQLNYAICYFNNVNHFFITDKEDIDVVQNRCWCLDKNNYVICNNKKDGLTVERKLHRAIMSKYYNISGMEIDHINHNKSDNRKCNLRLCTRSENCRNTKRQENSSGYRNIRYDSFSNLYVVEINVDSIRFRKFFKTLDEAIKYRNIIYKHPTINDFLYNNNELNMININYNNTANPFILFTNNFISDEIIKPFRIVNEDKFYRMSGD